MPLACFRWKDSNFISALETCQRHVPTLWRYRFGKFDAAFYQEIMLSSGVFRRETASGFYPWGKVEGCFFVFGHALGLSKAGGHEIKCGGSPSTNLHTHKAM